MPGYDSQVIMAAGAFIQGSSIELSADGPMKPPYAVYFQGGLTWEHAKLGILKSLQYMVDKELVSLMKKSEGTGLKKSDLCHRSRCFRSYGSYSGCCIRSCSYGSGTK